MKELEALKIGIPKLKKLYENNAKKMSKNDILGFDLTFVYLEKALQRLETIDNANPNEALECLEKMYDGYCMGYGIKDEHFKTIKQALLKAQEQDDKAKAFDLINEKRVDIKTLHWAYPSCEAYNVAIREQKDTWARKELTPEEFEFIGRLAGAK